MKDDEISCKGCGLVIKIDRARLGELKTCPVCGEPLEIPPGKGDWDWGSLADADGYVPLSRILASVPPSSSSWNSKELLSVIVQVLFVVYTFRFVFAWFLIDPENATPQDFNPLFILLDNLALGLAGVVPLLHVRVFRQSYSKLGLDIKNGNRARLVAMITIAVLVGLFIFLLDVVVSTMNVLLIERLGWSWLAPSPSQEAFETFISTSALNRAVVIVPYVFALVMMELFFRGVLQRGLADLQDAKAKENARTRGKKRSRFARGARVVIYSWLAGASFDLLLTLNYKAIFFTILLHLLLSIVFNFTRWSVVTMVAIGLYVLLSLLAM